MLYAEKVFIRGILNIILVLPMGSESKPCIIGLHDFCGVYKFLKDKYERLGMGEKLIELEANFGEVTWLKTYCSMCVKAAYAKSKKDIRYTVVNTL